MVRKNGNKTKADRLLGRRRLIILATLLAVAAIFYTINCPAIVGVAATTRELPIYCVKRDNKAVSLTFDAAWGKYIIGTLK